MDSSEKKDVIPDEVSGTSADDSSHSSISGRESDRNVRGVDQFCQKCITTYNIVTALLVRLLLLVHAALAVWLMVSLTGQTKFWPLLALLALLVAETLYTIIRRKGRESKWVCTCFLAYLCAVLPPVWLIELHRLETFNDALNSNSTLVDLASVNGLSVPFKLESSLTVSVLEQALLFLLVLCRWLLPRGDISRNELSQLLFVFMGVASDNMELFQLFDETQVRQDRVLTFVVLGVWSLSLTQFLFVLTATRNPQKSKVVHVESGQTPAEKRLQQRRQKKKGMCEVMFTTEIWSLLFSMMVQDGPYAAVRIYTLVRYDLITYTIIFFICKNLLVICLVLYRLAIICVTHCMDDDDDDNEHDDERMEVVSVTKEGSAPADANGSGGRGGSGKSLSRKRLLSSKVTPSDSAPAAVENVDSNC